MVALVLLNCFIVLLAHRLYLVLYLRLLEEFVNLQVHGFKLADEVEVYLFQFDQGCVLSLYLGQPLLLAALELCLTEVEPGIIDTRHLNLNFEWLLGTWRVFNIYNTNTCR